MQNSPADSDITSPNLDAAAPGATSENASISPPTHAPGSSAVPDTADLQKHLHLEPTAIVLAKVKGYRAWPAMVLDEDILPENIRKLKPKSIKLSKKPSAPVIVIPVRFFSDDTYIWIKSCDLKLLSPDEIDNYLSKRGNSKKRDMLTDAYYLAKHPPDMLEFNTWGSSGPPAIPDTLEDLDDEDGQPKKKLKLSIKLKKPRKGAATKASSSSNADKSASKKKSNKSKSKKAARKSNAADAGDANADEDDGSDYSDTDSQDGYDSDWGLDELHYNFDNGDYIFANQSEQNQFEHEFPRASELAHSLDQTQRKLSKIHNALTPVLLQETIPDDRELMPHLRELEKVVASLDTPLVAFLKSPLFRVLLLVLHKPQQRFPYKELRRAIQRILRHVNLEPCRLIEEDLDISSKSTENTPASEVKDDSVSENGENPPESTGVEIAV